LGLKLGIDDPEQWLEECPQRVLDNWIAHYRIEPWGNETELLSKIIGLLFFLCRKDGGEFEQIEKFMNSVAKLHMPSNWIGQENVKPMNRVTKEDLQARYEEARKAAEKGYG